MEITATSTFEDLCKATEPQGDGTALRVFALDERRQAMVFCGPEAEHLLLQFIQYAEALFNALELSQQEQQEAPRIKVADG